MPGIREETSVNTELHHKLKKKLYASVPRSEIRAYCGAENHPYSFDERDSADEYRAEYRDLGAHDLRDNARSG